MPSAVSSTSRSTTRLEASGLSKRRELPVGARALLEDLEGVLDLLPAPELVHDIREEPVDQLLDHVTSRPLGFLAEIEQLAFDAVANRPPLVFFDERERIDAERHVVTAQPPEFGDERLEDRRDAHCLIDPRAHVAQPELERRVQVMGPYVPTKSWMRRESRSR